MSDLFRIFTNSVDATAFEQAQVYAVAQTQAMLIPDPVMFSGTYTWAAPQPLVTPLALDGSTQWVVQWCPGPDDTPATPDVAATEWLTTWVAGPLPSTAILSSDFIARFTKTEQSAASAFASNTSSISTLINLLEASGVVDVTQSQVTDGVSDLVTVGVITQERAGQILNLEINSP